MKAEFDAAEAELEKLRQDKLDTARQMKSDGLPVELGRNLVGKNEEIA